MARVASTAVGGFYPTPPSLIPAIAARLGIQQDDRYSFFDPCAGEGDAVLGIMRDLFHRAYPELDGKPSISGRSEKFKLYAVEMEETRAGILKNLVCSTLGYSGAGQTLHTDAFQLRWELGEKQDNQGVQLLYLNPPYDSDKQFGRLEERFLERFTPSLCEDGVLVFVVPFYALAASAKTLATHYGSMACFRFPESEWGAYKQVVLYARHRKVPLLSPDETLLAKIERWSTKPETMPELTPTSKVLGELPRQPINPPNPHHYGGTKGPNYAEVGFKEFKALPMDVIRLRAGLRPWHITDKGGSFFPMRLVLPDPLADSLSTLTYPMAMAPKPAHIAAGIAAGVFNGERVSADDPTSGAPDLLVKGVFDRDFQTVEEKTNKHGEVTGVVQVQQPRLVVTVLDLSTHQLHTVTSSVETTGTLDPAKMTTGDLLTLYGKSLLAILRAHCPVLYNPNVPAHVFPLPALARPLYTAQAHATRAAVNLLGGPNVSRRRRQGKAVVVLGEIGSGKTSVAVAAGMAIGARKALSLCPPHLLQSWTDQVKILNPAATVHVLSTMKDVDAFAKMKPGALAWAVLSREAAKLGHGIEGVKHACPKCGTPVPSIDLAKRRATCEAAPMVPGTPEALAMRELMLQTLRLFPRSPFSTMFSGHVLQGAIRRYADDAATAEGQGTLPTYREKIAAPISASARMEALVWTVAGLWLDHPHAYEPVALKATMHLLAAVNRPELTAAVADRLYRTAAIYFPDSWGVGARLRAEVRTLLRFIPRKHPLLRLTAEGLAAMDGKYLSADWSKFFQEMGWKGGTQNPFAQPETDDSAVTVEGKSIAYQEIPLGSPAHYSAALENLWSCGGWTKAEPCGERLYQAIGEPMRYPLATYIARHYPDLFDFLVVDEGHEYSTDGSAQERAAHRLTGLQKPTMVLTGSVMNGYAESLFSNWWSLFPSFREEFDRDQRPAFVTRYGYRKRFLQDADKKSGEIVAYGSMSDRVEHREKDMGSAPGVLPLFVLKMLANCVTLHKADLALDLPPCREIPVTVPLTEAQASAHKSMVTALFDQVKADRYNRDLAGKLWGQVGEAPSHLDRCTSDTGNVKDGGYEVRYPESVGSCLVHRAEPFKASETILPKEKWLLDLLESEAAEGRPVLVLTWHVELMPRLAKLIHARTGWKVPILDPSKVPTGKRQSWIDKQVVDAKAPCLLTNPICIQTGLNNLVWFPTQAWTENPACNPIVYRQGVGRSDRIGQIADEVRIYFPLYEIASQKKMHSLLFHKVGVSAATDGLDAESALQAAGVGESGVTGFSVGKELYRLLESDF